jgi:RNA polymerase sigma-70 factor (ECF subfamily)
LLTDEALYARVLAGDRAALGELVVRYHRPLFQYLYRLTNSQQTAEDLAQDVFVRLITYRGRPPQRFRPWTYTVASNLARDHFRSAAYRREEATSFEDGADEPSAPGGVGMDDWTLQVARCEEVGAALQQLPPAQREAVVLRFYHDLQLEEMAEITGAPLGTVKSRLFQGLKRLKLSLAQEEAPAHDRPD